MIQAEEPEALEPAETLEAAEAETDAPADAIAIAVPAGLEVITLDAQALEVWLGVAEVMYNRLERTEMVATILEALRVFLKMGRFALKRWPIEGWDAIPDRERGADVIPVLLRYVITQSFRMVARKYPRVDLAQVLMAEALVKTVAVDANGRFDATRLASALDAAAGTGAPSALPSGLPGTGSAQRAGSGARPATTGASGAADAGNGQRRRRALGLRWRDR